MAQSATTVTTPNPTPPTNFSFTGATGANPPNFTRQQYANPFNMTAVNSPVTAADGRPQAPYGVNPNPGPYFDDGTGSATIAFAANTAALTGGTSAADNNTGTTPGTNNAGAGGTGFNTVVGSYPVKGGLVPAATSVAHEGAGTEVVVTQTYASGVHVPGTSQTPGGGGPAWSAGSPGGPLNTFSDLGSFTGTANAPNGQHASSLSPLTNPAISATPATALSPSTIASGTNTFALTVTGTGFTPQSVVYINNIPQVTVFVSATSLTVAAALKKATAGTLPVTVVTGGAVVTANAPNMTYT